MGDHRASIKINFQMHGVTSECDLWINWWRGAWDELPTAVTDFFRDAEAKSMTAFDNEQDKCEDEKRAARKEVADRARAKLTADELAALKDEL